MGHDYNAAADIIEGWEGGWSDHPDDPGGLTRFGWTLQSMIAKGLDLNMDGRVDRGDLEALTPEKARALYRVHYWDAVAADDLPAPLALVAFNSSVNQGPGRAARFLQRAVGARVDGIVGPKTLAAARSAWGKDSERVLREFLTWQMLHYSGLSAFVTFGKGWTRRTFGVALTAARWRDEIEFVAPVSVGTSRGAIAAALDEASAALNRVRARL